MSDITCTGCGGDAKDEHGIRMWGLVVENADQQLCRRCLEIVLKGTPVVLSALTHLVPYLKS